MRLIDADRLLSDRMKRMYYHLPNGDTAIPIIDIEHAPTVDAVEVVRCKDCRWNNGENYCLNEGTFFELCADDAYCSFGERRTDETD